MRKLNYARKQILEDLIQLRKAVDPYIVFFPRLHDIHQDHATVATEGLRAFKNKIILGYELIWNNLTFDTQCFVKLEQRHVQRKAEALKAYAPQSHRHYMPEDFIFSLAKARGVQVGAPYAEAFEIIRFIIS